MRYKWEKVLFRIVNFLSLVFTISGVSDKIGKVKAVFVLFIDAVFKTQYCL